MKEVRVDEVLERARKLYLLEAYGPYLHPKRVLYAKRASRWEVRSLSEAVVAAAGEFAYSHYEGRGSAADGLVRDAEAVLGASIPVYGPPRWHEPRDAAHFRTIFNRWRIDDHRSHDEALELFALALEEASPLHLSLPHYLLRT